MILLPHGCSCSEPSVNPKNWKTGGQSLMKKNWRITYYFRDPEFKEQYPYGKLIPIKGMNRFKTLEERREATRILIDEELYMLKIDGYNPITKLKNGPDIEITPDIDPNTPLCEAILLAKNRIEGEKSTLTDLKSCVKYFNKSARQLRLGLVRVGDIKRAHVRNILDNQQKQNKLSNNRYNKVRAYMQMVFKQLILADAIEYNHIDSLPLKKTVKKLNVTFSPEQVEVIKNHLIVKNYNFYRYMQIFFHSGCRSTELFNVKKSDVVLHQEQFKVIVKKGKHYEEQWRAINRNVMNLWQEVMKDAIKDDYIFSINFSPGPTKVAARQVSDKWREQVKVPLGIDINFYMLKHLHTTKVIDLYDNRSFAAGINGHKSTNMNDQHYDVKHQERILNKAKKINISL